MFSAISYPSLFLLHMNASIFLLSNVLFVKKKVRENRKDRGCKRIWVHVMTILRYHYWWITLLYLYFWCLYKVEKVEVQVHVTLSNL